MSHARRTRSSTLPPAPEDLFDTPSEKDRALEAMGKAQGLPLGTLLCEHKDLVSLAEAARHLRRKPAALQILRNAARVVDTLGLGPVEGCNTHLSLIVSRPEPEWRELADWIVDKQPTVKQLRARIAQKKGKKKTEDKAVEEGHQKTKKRTEPVHGRPHRYQNQPNFGRPVEEVEKRLAAREERHPDRPVTEKQLRKIFDVHETTLSGWRNRRLEGRHLPQKGATPRELREWLRLFSTFKLGPLENNGRQMTSHGRDDDDDDDDEGADIDARLAAFDEKHHAALEAAEAPIHSSSPGEGDAPSSAPQLKMHAELDGTQIQEAIEEYCGLRGFCCRREGIAFLVRHGTSDAAVDADALSARIGGSPAHDGRPPAERVWAIGSAPASAIKARWLDAHSFLTTAGEERSTWVCQFQAGGNTLQAGGRQVPGGVILTWWC